MAEGAPGRAVVVSGSRVALRVHHISDVVAGVTLGVAGAIAGAALLFP